MGFEVVELADSGKSFQDNQFCRGSIQKLVKVIFDIGDLRGISLYILQRERTDQLCIEISASTLF